MKNRGKKIKEGKDREKVKRETEKKKKGGKIKRETK